jgi:hypothetical protein
LKKHLLNHAIPQNKYKKLQNLGFHWISEDNEWYNDKDREMHIYFDEGLAEYVLLTFIWNDEESDYEKD